MSRFIIALALAGLSAACATQGDGETDQALGSPAVESEGASGVASAACEEAFAPLADMELESLSDLGDLQAEVEPTIESCESVADWIAAAQPLFEEEVNPNTAATLLRIGCGTPSMSNAPICEELASSS
jgi:hypothetical protein